MTNIGKSREQICRLGESLFNRGFTVGSSGNISVRLSDDRWLVTPTNACLGRLEPERLSVIDASGNLIDGDPPTKESFLHLAIYDQRPSDGAVVHLHSTHSVAVSLLPDVNPNQPVPPLTAYYVMKVRDLILLPYYAPGDLSLANAVKAVAGKHHAVLLANHGPIVSGKTVEEAVYASEELEETSKLFLLLKDQKPRTLTADQVIELKEKWHT
jgi:ribulose-5-phosphate 4-epimerase/fuculose-1-phosphate aldolase